MMATDNQHDQVFKTAQEQLGDRVKRRNFPAKAKRLAVGAALPARIAPAIAEVENYGPGAGI